MLLISGYKTIIFMIVRGHHSIFKRTYNMLKILIEIFVVIFEVIIFYYLKNLKVVML